MPISLAVGGWHFFLRSTPPLLSPLCPNLCFACYTYHDDSQGYEATEWLLRSPTGKEYYLLREVDPQNPESPVNWYLAEELVSPIAILNHL